MKVNLKKVMKKAHELAKKMVGDYAARLSLALRQVWEEVRNVVEKVLPELKGSEKQVAWAEEIRKVFVENIAEVLETAEKFVEEEVAFYGEEDKTLAKKGFGELIANVEAAKANDSAKFWIDNFKNLTSRFATATKVGCILNALAQNKVIEGIKEELVISTALFKAAEARKWQ